MRPCPKKIYKKVPSEKKKKTYKNIWKMCKHTQKTINAYAFVDGTFDEKSLSLLWHGLTSSRCQVKNALDVRFGAHEKILPAVTPEADQDI